MRRTRLTNVQSISGRRQFQVELINQASTTLDAYALNFTLYALENNLLSPNTIIVSGLQPTLRDGATLLILDGLRSSIWYRTIEMRTLNLRRFLVTHTVYEFQMACFDIGAYISMGFNALFTLLFAFIYYTYPSFAADSGPVVIPDRLPVALLADPLAQFQQGFSFTAGAALPLWAVLMLILAFYFALEFVLKLFLPPIAVTRRNGTN